MKRILLATIVALATGGAAAAADAPDKPAPSEASPEQVRDWVRALDADEFAKREEATACLAECGLCAVEEIAKLDLAAQNLEVVARGAHVLQELALADDVAVQDAAREVLEKLAGSNNPAAALRAHATLATLNEIRQGRAIEQLQKVGVRVTTNSTQVGLMLMHDLPMVEIDDNFTGTADDLKRLKHLNDVLLVQLSGPKITDEVLAQVAEMPNVQFLKIKWAKITGAGLAPLGKTRQKALAVAPGQAAIVPLAAGLQHVSVLYSPVGDEAVEPLLQIKTLSNVRLFGTDITAAGKAKLVEKLGEGDKVDVRHGAFLGIGCQRGDGGCEVTIVHPDSAAQKAGLQPGDIVVRFADEAVDDFPALTAAIAKYKARDTVTFEVLRPGGPKKIEVTLGEWEW